MDSPIWAELPATDRSTVDSLIKKDHRIAAVTHLREAFPVDSRPGLYETLGMVAERYRELGQRFERYPTPPLNLLTLTEEVNALPGRTVAIEALWDGDSDGWCVDLMALTDDPAASAGLRSSGTAVTCGCSTVRFLHGPKRRRPRRLVVPWPSTSACRSTSPVPINPTLTFPAGGPPREHPRGPARRPCCRAGPTTRGSFRPKEHGIAQSRNLASSPVSQGSERGRLLVLPAAVDFRAPAALCKPIDGQRYDPVPTMRPGATPAWKVEEKVYFGPTSGPARIMHRGDCRGVGAVPAVPTAVGSDVLAVRAPNRRSGRERSAGRDVLPAMTQAPGRTGQQRRLWPVRTALILTFTTAILIAGSVFITVWELLGAQGLKNQARLDSSTLFDLLKLSFGVVAGAGALVALVVAYRKQRVDEDAAERDLARLQQDSTRLHTERFTTAVTQLGDTNHAVRLGGVHALAGLADDAPTRDLRQTAIDVLCAYLRLPYTPETDLPPGDTAARHDYLAGREVRHTIIRLIGNHLRLSADHPHSWQGHDLDFTGVAFDGGDLHWAVFSGGTVTFAGAHFTSGTLTFEGADFTGGLVEFSDVHFSGGTVTFEGADFTGSSVFFLSTHFTGGAVTFRRATGTPPHGLNPAPGLELPSEW